MLVKFKQSYLQMKYIDISFQSLSWSSDIFCQSSDCVLLYCLFTQIYPTVCLKSSGTSLSLPNRSPVKQNQIKANWYPWNTKQRDKIKKENLNEWQNAKTKAEAKQSSKRWDKLDRSYANAPLKLWMVLAINLGEFYFLWSMFNVNTHASAHPW